MREKDHCSVPSRSNNRSKGQLGITFHRFPVDKYTKKSWIVRIRRDVGKNFQASDCVVRLQDKQALSVINFVQRNVVKQQLGSTHNSSRSN